MLLWKIPWKWMITMFNDYGKLTCCYGKSLSLMGKSSNFLWAIFIIAMWSYQRGEVWNLGQHSKIAWVLGLAYRWMTSIHWLLEIDPLINRYGKGKSMGSSERFPVSRVCLRFRIYRSRTHALMHTVSKPPPNSLGCTSKYNSPAHPGSFSHASANANGSKAFPR